MIPDGTDQCVTAPDACQHPCGAHRCFLKPGHPRAHRCICYHVWSPTMQPIPARITEVGPGRFRIDGYVHTPWVYADPGPTIEAS